MEEVEHNARIKAKIDVAIRYAKHALSIEDRELSAEAEILIRRQLSGEISEQEFLIQAKELS